LPDIYWNADTLFVLTESWAQAGELARLTEEEDCGGEIQVYQDREEIDRALGTGRDDYGVLTVWWN
jgi:hypothetical protein